MSSGTRGFARPAGEAAPPAAQRKALHLVEAVLQGRRWRDVTVDRTELRGRLRLLTRAEVAKIRDDIRASLAARGLAAGAPGVLEGFAEWREEMILRTVATAVRDDQDQPLGTIEDWAELTDVQLSALWDTYQDFETELDPFGSQGDPLTTQEARAILEAAKAGAIGQLMAFGSYKLARFATSSVEVQQT